MVYSASGRELTPILGGGVGKSKEGKGNVGRSYQEEKELRDSYWHCPEYIGNGVARFGQGTIRKHQKKNPNKQKNPQTQTQTITKNRIPS